MPGAGHTGCVETVRALCALLPLSRAGARAVSPHLLWPLLVVLGACSDARAPTASVPTPPPPVFSDPHLASGRAVWIGTCGGCHDIGVAGAPPLGDRDAWAPRIAKGAATLHAHALNGFFGPAGTMMPARGGNDSLRDDEVIAAVDYMVAASR